MKFPTLKIFADKGLEAVLYAKRQTLASQDRAEDVFLLQWRKCWTVESTIKATNKHLTNHDEVIIRIISQKPKRKV